MGQAPLMGTPCAFPLANMSTTPLCSQLCADALGARYTVFRIVTLTISCSAFALFLGRVFYIFKKLAEDGKGGGRQGGRGANFALKKSLEFWAFTGIFIGSFVLASIDFRGFAGVVSPQFYTIMNEISGASLVAAALILIDFWIVCASPMGRSAGLKYKITIIALIYVNFLGLVIAGLCDTKNFNLYDGIKGIIACLLILIWLVLAYTPMSQIKEALSAGGTSAKEKRSVMLTVLNRKFLAFYVLCSLGALLFLVSGIVSFTSKDPVYGYAWKTTCDISSLNALSKGIQTACCVAGFMFFALPKSSRATALGESSDQKHMQVAPASSPRNAADPSQPKSSSSVNQATNPSYVEPGSVNAGN